MPSKVIGKEELYIEYADKVMGYIRSKITNQADAEDLHSTVFLKVYQKFDTFDQTKASVSTWIYTITKNTVTDFFRTRHVHSEIEEDILDEGDEYQGILDEETLNELADALRPAVVQGMELRVHISREGKEAGQGVAYLEDGTMIVIENGKALIGEDADIVVTSVLQTSAGRMIFARLK